MGKIKKFVHTELPCDQWLAKKKTPTKNNPAANKMRKLLGLKKKHFNPMISMEYLSQPIDIKATRQTSLKSFFSKQPVLNNPVRGGSNVADEPELLSHPHMDKCTPKKCLGNEEDSKQVLKVSPLENDLTYSQPRRKVRTPKRTLKSKDKENDSKVRSGQHQVVVDGNDFETDVCSLQIPSGSGKRLNQSKMDRNIDCDSGMVNEPALICMESTTDHELLPSWKDSVLSQNSVVTISSHCSFDSQCGYHVKTVDIGQSQSTSSPVAQGYDYDLTASDHYSKDSVQRPLIQYERSIQRAVDDFELELKIHTDKLLQKNTTASHQDTETLPMTFHMNHSKDEQESQESFDYDVPLTFHVNTGEKCCDDESSHILELNSQMSSDEDSQFSPLTFH